MIRPPCSIWLPAPVFLLLILVMGMVTAGAAVATTELRDAAFVSSGTAALENGAGTVRLEDSRVGQMRPPIVVPEPGVLWQVGSGAGLLMLLTRRRCAVARVGQHPRPGQHPVEKVSLP